MIRIPITDSRLEINGLPWFGEGRFHRLPPDLQGRVSGNLWQCAACPSGARVRFRTNSSSIGVLAEVPELGSSSNMSVYGRAGLDAYVDGAYWSTVIPDGSGAMEKQLFEYAKRSMREIILYLPIYQPTVLKEVLLDDRSDILPPAPFAVKKTVVFYGTSITQGGCASRPGLTYPALLGRALNIDFVNLGFSGLGRGELPVQEATARIDASCFVLDMGQNNPDFYDLVEVFEPFYRTLRSAHPETPIIFTTPLLNTYENWLDDVRQLNRKRRALMRSVYESAHDKNLHLLDWIEAADMTDGDGFADYAHANDIGFARMKQGMLPLLSRVLGL